MAGAVYGLMISALFSEGVRVIAPGTINLFMEAAIRSFRPEMSKLRGFASTIIPKPTVKLG